MRFLSFDLIGSSKKRGEILKKVARERSLRAARGGRKKKGFDGIGIPHLLVPIHRVRRHPVIQDHGQHLQEMEKVSQVVGWQLARSQDVDGRGA
jgi:hypothetical protein